MQELHARHVAHCDLKLDNLLLISTATAATEGEAEAGDDRMAAGVAGGVDVLRASTSGGGGAWRLVLGDFSEALMFDDPAHAVVTESRGTEMYQVTGRHWG